MTDARAAVGMDRLPWLSDEPAPPPRQQPKLRAVKAPPAKSGSMRELAGWGVAALLLVAGGSYWLGSRSVQQPVTSSATSRPEATVRLPEVRESEQPQVPIADTPAVEPAPAPMAEAPKAAREARRTNAARRKRLSPMETSGSNLEKTVAEQEGETSKTETAKAPPNAAPVAVRPPAVRVARPQPLTLWPSRISQGAHGRIVRIGAFGTRQRAKLGWRRMQRAYPAIGRLPATVVTDRNSRGRVFYRFQIGTTSQAHSEVLCQRMARIRFSCAVVGLPWKAKVER